MRKKALFVVIPILIIIGLASGTYLYVNNTIYKSTKKSDIFSSKEEEEKAQYVEEQGVFNILLLGLDGRKKDTDSRTDSMILATIDTTKKKVKLVSFMRDMYVPIPGHGQSRVNSAFFLGGSELLMKTLNEDFDLDMQYYMTIDFKAFQALVDKMGGIDIEIKEKELNQINYYIKEANWKQPDYLKQAGYQHLNGQQALSYCRIRKVGNNDYERTERQRKVLSLLINKAKKISVFKLPSLFTTLLPYIKTNVPTTKLANLGYTVLKFGSTTVDTARIPADGMFEGMKINGADVLVPNIEKNVAYLDNFLTSNGSVGESNMPAYIANNFHADDEAIDKRNSKHAIVKIIIPKKSTISHEFDQKPETPIDNQTQTDLNKDSNEVQTNDDTGIIDNSGTNGKDTSNNSDTNNTSDNTDNNTSNTKDTNNTNPPAQNNTDNSKEQTTTQGITIN